MVVMTLMLITFQVGQLVFRMRFCLNSTMHTSTTAGELLQCKAEKCDKGQNAIHNKSPTTHRLRVVVSTLSVECQLRVHRFFLKIHPQQCNDESLVAPVYRCRQDVKATSLPSLPISRLTGPHPFERQRVVNRSHHLLPFDSRSLFGSTLQVVTAKPFPVLRDSMHL